MVLRAPSDDRSHKGVESLRIGRLDAPSRKSRKCTPIATSNDDIAAAGISAATISTSGIAPPVEDMIVEDETEGPNDRHDVADVTEDSGAKTGLALSRSGGRGSSAKARCGGAMKVRV